MIFRDAWRPCSNGAVSRPRIITRALLIAALSLPTATASADDFQSAWNAGMRALGQAKYDEACDHFSRAETIGGTSIKTRYQLGRCNEERQSYVAAHGYFLDAARLAELEGNAQQADVARKRIEDIETKVPIVILEVPASTRVAGMTVKLGDDEIPPQNWGHPIAVEPGTYPVVVTAPNMQTLNLEVAAPRAGQRSQLVIPALSPAGPPPVAGPQPVIVAPPAPAAPDAPEMKRKNPALFFTGMGMIIGGGVAGIAGLVAYGASSIEADLSGGSDDVPPAAIGLWIGGAALIGVGIPFMVVFGRKVPVDGEEPAAAPASEAMRLETVIGPTGGSLRLTF